MVFYMVKKKKLLFRETIKYFVWGLSGILLAWALTAMILSPNGNIFCFFDEGETEDYDVLPINSLSDTLGMQMDNGVLEIVGADACKEILLRGDGTKQWRYLYVHLSHMNSGTLDCTLIGCDSAGTQILEQSVSLMPGRNEILLSQTGSSRISLNFLGETGKKFYISRFDLASEKRELPDRGYAILFLFLLGVYAALSRVIHKKNRWPRASFSTFQDFLDIMQILYMGIYLRAFEFMEKIPEKVKCCLRIVCFFCIFSVNIYVTGFSNYHNTRVYRFEILSVCVCLFLAALLYMQKDMEKISYKNPLVISWYILCIMMILSDFIVPKKTMYTGYWLLFCWGFFFWVWTNMDNRQKVLRELTVAFSWVFGLSTAFCLFCTQRNPEYYKGMTNNPNTLGQFMSVSIVVILSRLLSENNSYRKLLLISVATDFALYFTVMSQCRSAILADVCIFALFLLYLTRLAKRRSENRTLLKRCLICTCVTLILFIPVSLTGEYIMCHNYGIASYFQSAAKDERTLADKTDEVHAAEVTKDKILQRFKESMDLNQFSSGRLYIYSKYWKNLNLLGHKGNLDVNGIGTGAHNSILMIGYNYGIFAIIPFSVILLCGFFYSWENMASAYRQPEKYGFFLCAMLICTIICGMLDHIEQPMRYIPWFMMYFTIGYFFRWDETDADKIIYK